MPPSGCSPSLSPLLPPSRPPTTIITETSGIHHRYKSRLLATRTSSSLVLPALARAQLFHRRLNVHSCRVKIKIGLLFSSLGFGEKWTCDLDPCHSVRFTSWWTKSNNVFTRLSFIIVVVIFDNTFKLLLIKLVVIKSFNSKKKVCCVTGLWIIQRKT